MKTITMLPFLVAALGVIATQVCNAQFREPEVLPGLLWVRSDTLPGREMMWNLADSTPTNPTPVISDFEIGWNWTTVPWNAGALMGIRRFHCGDLRENADSSVRMLDLMKAAEASSYCNSVYGVVRYSLFATRCSTHPHFSMSSERSSARCWGVISAHFFSRLVLRWNKGLADVRSEAPYLNENMMT